MATAFLQIGHEIIFMIILSLTLIQVGQLLVKSYEPPCDKTNKMACAPSEDSDQPGHLPSLISLRCPHEESLGPKLSNERTAKTLIRLGAHVILLVLSRGGSYALSTDYPLGGLSLSSNSMFVCSGLMSLSTIFQSYHDGVWL